MSGFDFFADILALRWFTAGGDIAVFGGVSGTRGRTVGGASFLAEATAEGGRSRFLGKNYESISVSAKGWRFGWRLG